MQQQIPIPILPEAWLQTAGVPWTNYVSRHLAWKRQALPWLPDEKLQDTARADLQAMQLGFPAVDDEACALGLAACLTIVCYVDSFIEEMEPEMANQCVKRCLAILDGDILDNRIGKALSTPFRIVTNYIDEAENPRNSSEKAQTICSAFYKQMLALFHPKTAVAVIYDMKDMIASQLLELDFKEGILLIKTYGEYLEIRNRTFGLMPLLTIAEHYYLAEGDSLAASPDISLLKTQISLMGVGQNDIGGLEKDIQLSNPSNSIMVLATLLGRKPIVSANSLLESQDILSLFEKENQRFINDVVKTWSRIQIRSTRKEERRLSNTLITLCVTHLKWVLSTSRYNIDDVLQGDCIGS